jgi:hypothetical protein
LEDVVARLARYSTAAGRCPFGVAFTPVIR